MEIIEVAVSIMVLVITMATPFFIWIVVSIFSMKQDIALNKANDDAVEKQVLTLIAKIDAISEQFIDLKQALAESGVKFKSK